MIIYKCEYCKKVFDRKLNLIRHYNRKFKCYDTTQIKILKIKDENGNIIEELFDDFDTQKEPQILTQTQKSIQKNTQNPKKTKKTTQIEENTQKIIQKEQKINTNETVEEQEINRTETVEEQKINTNETVEEQKINTNETAEEQKINTNETVEEQKINTNETAEEQKISPNNVNNKILEEIKTNENLLLTPQNKIIEKEKINETEEVKTNENLVLTAKDPNTKKIHIENDDLNLIYKKGFKDEYPNKIIEYPQDLLNQFDPSIRDIVKILIKKCHIEKLSFEDFDKLFLKHTEIHKSKNKSKTYRERTKPRAKTVKNYYNSVSFV